MVIFLYVVLGVMAIAAVAIATTVLRDKRRARELAHISLRLGFSYEADGRDLPAEGLSALPFFAITQLPGHSTIRNVLRRHGSGAELCLCDFHYWTGGSGSNRSDHDQTVACFKLDRQEFPAFSLRERLGPAKREAVLAGLKMGIPGRMGGASFGRALEMLTQSLEDEGIQVAGHPEFNRRFWLRSREHAEETRALFREEVVGFLDRREQPLCLENEGRWLIVYQKNTRVKPEEIGSFRDEAERLLQLLRQAAA